MPQFAGYAPSSTTGIVTGPQTYAARATLAFTDTVAKTLFTLPDGAVIVEWILNVTTAFDDAVTDVIDIGVTGTAQKYAASVDVIATGLKTVGVDLTQIGVAQSGAQIVKGIYTPATSATAGAMTILCEYYRS